MASELEESDCYVALTHDNLNTQLMMDRVRSPKAGAIVLFAGDFPLSIRQPVN
jgi:molybdopterin synthase catalytic subunit